jgi:hypothetical protein
MVSATAHITPGFEIRFHFFRDRCPSQAKFHGTGNCPSFVQGPEIAEKVSPWMQLIVKACIVCKLRDAAL